MTEETKVQKESRWRNYTTIAALKSTRDELNNLKVHNKQPNGELILELINFYKEHSKKKVEEK